MTEKEILYKIYLALTGHLSENDLKFLAGVIIEGFGDSVVVANKLQKLTKQFERSFDFSILERSLAFVKKLDNLKILDRVIDIAENIMLNERFSEKAMRHYSNYIELLMVYNPSRIDAFETKLVERNNIWDLMKYVQEIPLFNKRKVFGKMLKNKTENMYSIKNFIKLYPEYTKFVPLM